MPELFVDIETAPRMSAAEYAGARARIDSGDLHKDSPDKGLYWAVERGALTPFEGKVILITYKVNDGHVFRIAEWDSGEEGMLRRFYNLVVDLQRGQREGDSQRLPAFFTFLYFRLITSNFIYCQNHG